MQAMTPTLYGQMHRLAIHYMQQERLNHTLDASDLVHEAYIRLAGSFSAKDRNHFIASSAGTMRRVLVDHARQKKAMKRGSDGDQVTLATGILASNGPDIDVLDLDLALERLGDVKPEVARVIELRYFGGLTCEEVAEVLELSLTTVERRWRAGKIWLRHKLKPN